jgi:hypothetical protein
LQRQPTMTAAPGTRPRLPPNEIRAVRLESRRPFLSRRPRMCSDRVCRVTSKAACILQLALVIVQPGITVRRRALRRFSAGGTTRSTRGT